MGMISADVLELEQLSLQDFPRLGRLREAHFDNKPEICLELARNTTAFFKAEEAAAATSGRQDELQSAEVTAGKLYELVMSSKQAIVADENLLAGTTTTKQKGVVLYPHFLSLSIWPELETIADRQKNPFLITDEDRKELNESIFPFWMDRTVQELARKDFGTNGNTPESQRILEHLVFYLTSKVYAISHTIPNYEVVLQEGLQGIIDEALAKEQGLGPGIDDRKKKDFYQAVRQSLGGIIHYAEQLSIEAEQQAILMESAGNSGRAGELHQISACLGRVPARPPETFQEALNALWICKIAVHQENANIAMSLGRLDQVLYPFYRRDIENGLITPRDAVELVGCLWLKIVDHVPVVPEVSEELFGGSGSNQAITLGGIDKDGNDAVNDLTYVMLEATELLQLRDPNVNARYHPLVNTKEYRDRLARLNLKTRATPCFHNDVATIELLKTQDILDEDALDYAISSCVEPTSPGRTYGATGMCLVNLSSILELTLFGGRHRLTGLKEDDPVWHAGPPAAGMQSFDDFRATFEQHLDWLVNHVVELNNNLGLTHRKAHPTPMLSAMMEGCVKNGKDVIDGGAKYNFTGATIIGLADVVDSITAVEEFVFGNGTASMIPMSDMVGAITTDWGSEEKDEQKAALYRKYHAMVKASQNRFGHDGSPMAERNALWLVDLLHNKFQAKLNYRGGRYTVGYWTVTNHAGFGVLTGALPSGRVKGKPFASGITPVEELAPELPSCLRFVGTLDRTLHMTNGHALNLKFTPPRADDPENGGAFLNCFTAYLDTYFKDYGGLQVQCNIIGREELWNAYMNPSTCPRDLFVRVSGYTAYFKDLNTHMQREIISRAEYDICSGLAIGEGWDEKLYGTAPAAISPAGTRPSITAETKAALDPILKWLLSHSAEAVLGGLIDYMRGVHFVNKHFRKLVGDFKGTLLFQTRDGAVRKYVRFYDGHMESDEKMSGKPNVTITFTDGRALVNFLFSPLRDYLNDFIKDGKVDDHHTFDIIAGLLRNEITVDGNLNYLYRFGFLANHLLLYPFGGP